MKINCIIETFIKVLENKVSQKSDKPYAWTGTSVAERTTHPHRQGVAFHRPQCEEHPPNARLLKSELRGSDEMISEE